MHVYEGKKVYLDPSVKTPEGTLNKENNVNINIPIEEAVIMMINVDINLSLTSSTPRFPTGS